MQRRIGALKTPIPIVTKNLLVSRDPNWNCLSLQPFNANIGVVVGYRSSRSQEALAVADFSSNEQAKSFDMSNIHEALTDTNTSDFIEFDRNEIESAFNEALQNQNLIRNKSLVLTLCPGKLIFLRKGHNPCTKLRRGGLLSEGKRYLKRERVSTFFAPNMRPDYFYKFSEKLRRQGFENLNANSPDSYSIVHSEVKEGNNNVPYIVRMASESGQENAVDKILSCKTIGEVFPRVEKSKLKINFFKWSKLLQTDLNLYDGVQDALKILQDAYEKLEKGASPTTPVFSLGSQSQTSNNLENVQISPKVIKIRKDKVRLCTLTTLSEKKLDVRATLSVFEEDEENLPEEVENSLKKCWNARH